MILWYRLIKNISRISEEFALKLQHHIWNPRILEDFKPRSVWNQDSIDWGTRWKAKAQIAELETSLSLVMGLNQRNLDMFIYVKRNINRLILYILIKLINYTKGIQNCVCVCVF